MKVLRSCILLFLLTFFVASLHAQQGFSVVTDVGILRNTGRLMRFTTVGQTIGSQLHLNTKTTLYASFSYYLRGRYTNGFIATAKTPAVTPQRFEFASTTNLRYNLISMGIKQYFKGSSHAESGYSIYGAAGFGLLTMRLQNEWSQPVDTARYAIMQSSIEGEGGVRRLTFDAALGAELPLGADVYLYGEVRSWFTASGYPSPYLYYNRVSNSISGHAGLRILFY